MPRRRIDVHQHIVPPAYVRWLAANGVRDAGGRDLPAWSADEALAVMDAHDIESAVVSVSTPGVHLAPGARHDAVARAKAREVNEFAARLAADHPGRFGHPALKIILAHAGGFVPYASHRLAAALAVETGRPPLEILDDLASFYFDTALSGSPAALPSLLAFARPGHVLFGTDWPYAPSIAVSWFTGQLDAYAALDDDGHAAIDRGNAALLFPEPAARAPQENA